MIHILINGIGQKNNMVITFYELPMLSGTW